MITQVGAILIAYLLADISTANVILEGLGTDEISGYIISPVTGISRIHLHRKLRRQVNLHIPLVPYVDESKTKKLSPIVTNSIPGDDEEDEDLMEKSPMGESFFQIDDEE